MQAHRVSALLMGGQACVLYGAAEFSRDTDLALLASGQNLVRLRRALAELKAEPIAVPPLELRFLRRGHAVHFRCRHEEAPNIRVDLMSRMRGVSGFATLWRRRTSIRLPDDTVANVLSLPDLVLAKKTQRDKDWPMIRRLLEAHYFEHRSDPNRARVRFWLRELRTPELLVEVVRSHGAVARSLLSGRPLLASAINSDMLALSLALRDEEDAERARDRDYWEPLRRELERLRHSR